MIAKHRTLPVSILKREALLRRLPANHPKYSVVEGDLYKRKAGFRGEEEVDYYLRQLPGKNHMIYQDIRLPNGSDHFQLDTLLVCRNFMLVIEVKNISGTLYFDQSFNQLIRTQNGKEESFPDPILQAKLQRWKLSEWLQYNKFESIPIEYLIVMGKSPGIVKISPGSEKIFQKVCPASNILFKIKELERYYSKENISLQVLKKLNKLLLKSHCPHDMDILRHHSVADKDIITGVQCPSCSVFSMERRYGKWYCQKCNTKSKDAHIQSLNDYFLLFHPSITNQQFRDFHHITSIHTACKLLAKLNLPHTGINKGRVYHQPPF
ncbi:nuclease-related domain-containing protein [Bacillus sp. T33-2]|uniref:nuclease-related domain-containing protein n=1 Tax=Bacillus sp. T33-2 TaxID=2054168 RepID=UPI0015E09C39|nr:nuclease-related domain-containing protein [Bacillus sp. T33-2]